LTPTPTALQDCADARLITEKADIHAALRRPINRGQQRVEVVMDTKQCRVCERVLPLDQFKQRPDTGKRRTECYACLAEFFRRNRLKRPPEYGSWRAMKKRCRCPKHPDYKHYGGRGITVCERWNDFDAFLADMGPKPTPAHEIDRIDNDGYYCPENCRWATRTINGQNRRCVKLDIEKASEIKHLRINGVSEMDIAQRFGIARTTVRNIVKGYRWRNAV